MADTGPLVLGANVSEMVADGTASSGAQQKPAMKRRKHSAPKLCVKPAPRVKSAPSGMPYR